MKNQVLSIQTVKAGKDADPRASKFFGDPVLPIAWESLMEDFEETLLFFAQIRLSDIAQYDTENKLPHKGFLYFFLDTLYYPYTPKVLYSEDERPTLVVKGFNKEVPEFERYTKAFLMNFVPDEEAEGTKLFGNPSGIDYEDEDLLLQYDPLDNSTGFLSELDGRAYFLFSPDLKPENTTFIIDRA